MTRDQFALAVAALTLAGNTALAQYVDWSQVTLDGDNPYTFTDAALGDVTITYSGNYKLPGVIWNFGSQALLGLGENGQGSGTVTVSWTQPLVSLNVQMWDLDLGEFDLIYVPDGVELTLIADNPLTGTDELIGNKMTGAGGDLPNGNTNNYAEVQMSGAAFTQFAIEFQRPGNNSGGHALGMGEAVVPAPATLALLGLGGLCARSRRR